MIESKKGEWGTEVSNKNDDDSLHKVFLYDMFSRLCCRIKIKRRSVWQKTTARGVRYSSSFCP